jgi:hypothetical protein
MALILQQRLAIPLSMIALCAIALISVSRPPPVLVTALLAMAVAASMIMGWWLRRPRRLIAGRHVSSGDARPGGLTVHVSTGSACVRALPRSSDLTTEETNDALDSFAWTMMAGGRSRWTPLPTTFGSSLRRTDFERTGHCERRDNHGTSKQDAEPGRLAAGVSGHAHRAAIWSDRRRTALFR